MKTIVLKSKEIGKIKATLMSENEPRLISPGNHLAKIDGDSSIFKGLNSLELVIEQDS